jgi:DNA-binding MurR/RpiR family transcriptional regulator
VGEINIIDRLIEKSELLPKKQKALCKDIIENYREVNILTVSELAERNNVGATTVIRLVQSVGYKSFQDFKKCLQEYTLTSSVDKWSYLKNSFKDNISSNHTLPTSMQNLVQALNQTVNEETIKSFNKVVSLLIEARQIHVLGVRVSKIAALYFDMVLSSFQTNVNQLSYDNEFVFDRILQFKEGDILVVFASSIMTKRAIQAVKLCNELQHKIIIITDLLPCPASSYAEVVLHARSSNNQFSIVPLLAIVEALIIETGRQTAGDSINNLDKLGKLLRDKNISI